MPQTAEAGINWTVTRTDYDLIAKIAQRAASEFNFTDDRMTLLMDLTACHANGCPLQLAELLEAEPGDFGHDVGGIVGHMNRQTGELGDCFLPRYAKPEQATP
jgi:hypothetical protein